MVVEIEDAKRAAKGGAQLLGNLAYDVLALVLHLNVTVL
jgi:hypothetical protein